MPAMTSALPETLADHTSPASLLDENLLLSTSVAVKHLDSVDGDLLRDAVGGRANRAGDVSSVAVIVSGSTGDERSGKGRTTLKLLFADIRNEKCHKKASSTYRVSFVNSGVNDIGADTLSGGGVVGVSGGAGLGVGKAGKTPRGTLLHIKSLGPGVLFNVLDL